MTFFAMSVRNTETKEVSKSHPLDAYFVELRNRRRKEARSKRSTRTLSISESPRDVNEQEDTLKALEGADRTRPRRSKKTIQNSKNASLF